MTLIAGQLYRLADLGRYTQPQITLYTPGNQTIWTDHLTRDELYHPGSRARWIYLGRTDGGIGAGWIPQFRLFPPDDRGVTETVDGKLRLKKPTVFAVGSVVCRTFDDDGVYVSEVVKSIPLTVRDIKLKMVTDLAWEVLDESERHDVTPEAETVFPESEESELSAALLGILQGKQRLWNLQRKHYPRW